MMIASRSQSVLGALAGLLLIGLAGCGEAQDAAIVTISSPPDVSVTHVVLDLTIGSHSSSVMVPAADSAPLTLPKTVAVTFPSGLGAMLEVVAHGYSGANHVADGTASVPVVAHGVTLLGVIIMPIPHVDGGVFDGIGPATDMGPSPADMPLSMPDLTDPADLRPQG